MSGGTSIVLCCSDADRAAMEPASAELEAQGHRVLFVEGVARDPKLLGPVIEQLAREGLYVLCRSQGLGRGAIEELREILLAQQVPFSRTLTVAAARPELLTSRILSSLGRAGKTTTPPAATPRRAPAPTRPHPADAPTVDLPRDDATPRGARERAAFVPYADADDEPPTLRHEGIDAADGEDTGALSSDATGISQAPTAAEPDVARLPALSRGRRPPPPPPPPRRAPSYEENSVVAPLPRASSVDLVMEPPQPGDDSLARMAASISDIDLSDLDYGDTNIGRAAYRGDDGTRRVSSAEIGLLSGHTVVAALPAVISGNTVRARPPELDAMTPTGMADPSVAHSIAYTPELVPRSPPFAAPRIPATHSSPHIPPAVGGHSPITAAAAPRAGVPRVVFVAAGLAVGALAIAAVVYAVRSDGEDPKLAASKAGTSTPKADATRSDGDAARKPDPAQHDANAAGQASGDAGQDDPDEVLPPPSTVLAAIQRRNVRALDILLVQSRAGQVLSWADADTYCRTLEVDGLVDWRLPEVGELRSLSSASFIGGRPTFWSSTPADTFGDTHLAFTPKRDRVVDGARTAVALCVRGDRARS